MAGTCSGRCCRAPPRPLGFGRKVVDATYNSPRVPSTHTPRLLVTPGVRLVPPNALPGLAEAHGSPPIRRFVVLGGAKTAMDTCAWLMQSGADPDSITWVMPRDFWLINRVTTQPAEEFFDETIGGQAEQMQAFSTATGTGTGTCSYGWRPAAR